MHLGSNYVLDLRRELSKGLSPVIVGTTEREVIQVNFELLLPIEVDEFFSEFF